MISEMLELDVLQQIENLTKDILTYTRNGGHYPPEIFATVEEANLKFKFNQPKIIWQPINPFSALTREMEPLTEKEITRNERMQ